MADVYNAELHVSIKKAWPNRVFFSMLTGMKHTAKTERVGRSERAGVLLQVLFLGFLIAGFSSCASGAAAVGEGFSIDDIVVRELAKIDLENHQDRVLIFIHGAGDSPADWSQALAEQTGGFAVDWEAAAAQRMQAPERGYQIGLAMGKALGKALAEEYQDDDADAKSGSRSERQPEKFFLVAHSAGAWLAQGITDGLQQSALQIVQQEAPQAAAVEIVFLDPFTAKSVFQPFSGGRLLGVGADAVRTYYTTTDPIPFTAGKVAVGERIDVTDLLDSTDSSSTESRTLAHWKVIDYAAEIEFPAYIE